MLFLLGNLLLTGGEPIYIGDPCYIPNSTDLLVKYDQQWVKKPPPWRSEHIEGSDPTYDAIMKELHDIRMLSGEMNGGFILRVYVDMQINEWSKHASPGAFILWKPNGKDYEETMPDLECKLTEIGVVPVDSGQVSIIAEHMMDTWAGAHERDHSKTSAENNDYEACSDITLYTQLQAGAHKRHTVYNVHGYPSSATATVFSSRTFDGDGCYAVYIMSKEVDGVEQNLGLLVDFSGIYSPPEEDDDDESIEEEATIE